MANEAVPSSVRIVSPNGATAAAVKPGNTAPSASDPALVVVLSPNGGGGGGGSTVTANQGTAGASPWPVSDGGGSLTVDGTVNVGNLPAVQPVSDNGGSLTVDGTVNVGNLPADPATSAKQDTGNASLASIDGKLPALAGGRVPVDGSGVTQPVEGTSQMGAPPPALPEALLVQPTTVFPSTKSFFWNGDGTVDRIEVLMDNGTKKLVRQFTWVGDSLATIVETITNA